MNRLLFSDYGSSTRGERQFLKVFRNYTMLTTPSNVRHISWCFRSQFIFAGRNLKKLTAAATAENLTVCLIGLMSTFNGRTSTSQHHGRNSTDVIFKIFQILSPSLLGMMSSTLQPHFLFGVYYENSDCHILCA